SSSILRNGSLVVRHESGVTDRTPIQSIWAFTNAGASGGSALTATRLITRCAVTPHASSGVGDAASASDRAVASVRRRIDSWLRIQRISGVRAQRTRRRPELQIEPRQP